MKKITVFLITGLLVLAIAASVAFAGPGRGPAINCQSVAMTDAQKEELVPLQNQMLELRKQMLAKQVQWGNLTQEEADQRITWMKERMEKGYGPGMMMGRGPGRGHGPMWQQQTTNN